MRDRADCNYWVIGPVGGVGFSRMAFSARGGGEIYNINLHERSRYFGSLGLVGYNQ